MNRILKNLGIKTKDVYHEWGDDWPYWKDLNEVMDYIWKYVFKRSRCSVIMKEKYGTIRYEWVIPKDYRWNSKIDFLYNMHVKLGRFFLEKAIFKACNKWPHVRNEILDDYWKF